MKAGNSDIQLKRLPNVDKRDVIDLMNHPLLARHMPLLKLPFTENDYDEFIAAKEHLWDKYGYGPWAFLVDCRFAGWGGLQPENGDADLALVLHPNYWGCGKPIYELILNQGFGKMGFESVTALLPLSRRRDRVLKYLGFRFEKQVQLDGHFFIKYRLRAGQR